MTRLHKLSLSACAEFHLHARRLALGPGPTQRPSTARPRLPRHPLRHLRHLEPGGQSLSAIAKVDFVANEVSGGIRVELNQNLDLKDVKTPTAKLSISSATPATLSSSPSSCLNPSPPEQKSLSPSPTPAYSPIEDNSPVPGLRTAVISKEGAYLLLPARWFPLTNYPANRYTATFHLNVPDSFAVAGTGKASAPTPLAGGRLLYTFRSATRPSPTAPSSPVN